MALPLPFVSVEMSFAQAQALGRSMGRWGVRGIEAVSDLSPCLSHSTSICGVSAACQALHWEYGGKKRAAVSRGLTGVPECDSCSVTFCWWVLWEPLNLFELQVCHLESR